MLSSRSIRSRKIRKKIPHSFELQLTSMLDVMVIILVFLLKSYASSTSSLTTFPGVQLPVSRSGEPPHDSFHLVITPEAMVFENERILDFIQTEDNLGETTYNIKESELDDGGKRVLPLYNALLQSREKAEILRMKSKARDEKGQPLPFDSVLAIQADKRIDYNTLRKVMYTAGTAGYTIFHFLAQKPHGG